MEKKITNVLFAGIGGQGIIRASDMLTELAFRLDYDVKKSELHGMSQRGGSVTSDVRFGDSVLSPMIPEGETDYLIAVSEDQITVVSPFLNDKTVIIGPSMLSQEDANSRMANTVMLGILNQYLKFPTEQWIALIKENFPGPVGDANVEAFMRGMNSKLARDME